MTERTKNRKSGEDAEAKAREAAFEAWQPTATPADADEPVLWRPPRRRIAFPPSFLLIVAGACVLFALEPTGDLRYELLGPSAAVDLGHPQGYHFDRAADGQRAHVSGYLGTVVYASDPWGDDYEVGILKNTAVLVRRPRHPPQPADAVSMFEGEGRLIALGDSPATFVERMFDSTSRYNVLRLHYEAFGELAKGRPAWLLIDGDLPRKQPWRIARPILLWVGALAFSLLAWRSHRIRSEEAATRRRP